MKLVIRILINAAALWLTALILPNIDLTTNFGGILIVAIIFGLVSRERAEAKARMTKNE